MINVYEEEALQRVKRQHEINTGIPANVLFCSKPLYKKITADEYERMTARIAELERMDTEHTLQIAKMNGYIHQLEEERRWRKFSEEKPDDKQVVLVYGDEFFDTAIYHDNGSIDFGDDIHFSNITETPYWMPRPSAPEEMGK